MTVTISLGVRNAMLNAVIAYIKGTAAGTAYVDIRDGAVPAVTAAISGIRKAKIDFPAAPAAPFPASTTGSVVQNNFTADTATVAGTPTYFRVMSGDAAPVTVLQGTVGTASPADLIFTNTVWQAGGTADITSMTLTVPVSCA